MSFRERKFDQSLILSIVHSLYLVFTGQRFLIRMFIVCLLDLICRVRFWFNFGLLLFVVASCLVLYMAVWVPRVVKCDLDPAVYSPKMIPVTALCSVLSGLFLIFGLWPVYGLFTPGLLGLLWIASLMSAHFLPAL